MTAKERSAREGRLERTEDGRWRLRFERVLPHEPARVWAALTEEAHLAAWFPTTIEGELRVGSPLTFRFRGDEAPPTTGEVLACEAGRVLEFTWGESEEDIDEQERTRFELHPEGAGCRLLLLTTYDRVGKSARDATGWHVCLDYLAAHLAGDPPPAATSSYGAVNRRYREAFGPEASTIGPPRAFTEGESD